MLDNKTESPTETPNLNAPAYPVEGINGFTQSPSVYDGCLGLTKLEAFALRAPHEIPEGFEPMMEMDMPEGYDCNKRGNDNDKKFRKEYYHQSSAQWPWAWARMVLEARP